MTMLWLAMAWIICGTRYMDGNHVHHDGQVGFFKGVSKVYEGGVIEGFFPTDGQVQIGEWPGLTNHPGPESPYLPIGDVPTGDVLHHHQPAGPDLQVGDDVLVWVVHKSMAVWPCNRMSNARAWREKSGIEAATPAATGSL